MDIIGNADLREGGEELICLDILIEHELKCGEEKYPCLGKVSHASHDLLKGSPPKHAAMVAEDAEGHHEEEDFTLQKETVPDAAGGWNGRGFGKQGQKPVHEVVLSRNAQVLKVLEQSWQVVGEQEVKYADMPDNLLNVHGVERGEEGIGHESG